MNLDFKKYLLQTTNATSCKEVEVIQSLWSGYGKVSRFQLSDSIYPTVVIKFISLSVTSDHPRGWNTDYSHNRKVKSYQVETQWYKYWNHLTNKNCRIPKFIGSYFVDYKQWIIMEDLNGSFPIRKNHISLSEVKTCLKWLAKFHITFLNKEPKDLWKIGSYWNLKTRPEEFEKIENLELKSKAHLIDQKLNSCKYQTIIHGDAKLANFCFSEDSSQVAAVDFQYIGGGCGIKDVAYFLGSCLSSDECEQYENELLDYYFFELKKSFQSFNFSYEFKKLEKEWRELHPIACTDFVRFLLGWMPSHQKVNNYNLRMMESVLSSL